MNIPSAYLYGMDAGANLRHVIDDLHAAVVARIARAMDSYILAFGLFDARKLLA